MFKIESNASCFFLSHIFQSLGLFKHLMMMRRIINHFFTNQDGQSSSSDSFSRYRLMLPGMLLHVSLPVGPSWKKKSFQEMITVVTDFEHLYFPFYCIFCGGNASKSWVMAWTSFLEHTCDEYLQPKGTRKPFVFIDDFCVFRRHFSLSSNEFHRWSLIWNALWC